MPKPIGSASSRLLWSPPFAESPTPPPPSQAATPSRAIATRPPSPSSAIPRGAGGRGRRRTPCTRSSPLQPAAYPTTSGAHPRSRRRSPSRPVELARTQTAALGRAADGAPCAAMRPSASGSAPIHAHRLAGPLPQHGCRQGRLLLAGLHRVLSVLILFLALLELSLPPLTGSAAPARLGPIHRRPHDLLHSPYLPSRPIASSSLPVSRRAAAGAGHRCPPPHAASNHPSARA
ncbi:hypothetical protein PVAP13_3KG162800 [Panicum virgatum]|uniref:Uncharacterized protein n=1 Tax=Panicum virgatum TaxID=38727 RepID=A0A8T0URW9_PANVG|nr:hypothetical protein PVAP13_3KG162800 [Panicum virgatum]